MSKISWKNFIGSAGFLILSAIVSAFVAGVSSVTYITSKIKTEVRESLLNPEISKHLPKGDKGDIGPPGISVPVGGVLAYGGAIAKLSNSFVLPPQLSANYEICDGELVLTEGSPIVGWRKPDLRGKFLRGMTTAEYGLLQATLSERSYVTGGVNENDISHSHDDGNLVALFDPDLGGWAHMFFAPVPGEKRQYPRGHGGQSTLKNTGDRAATKGIDVIGTTGLWSKSLDNRPEHSALIYIIRVK